MDEARYREAERRLWDWVGLSPTERRVTLARNDVTVRVQEVGDGPPVLFLHGGPNSGSTWAPLVRHLPGFRSILLDRPGTGLSDPLPGPVSVEPTLALADTVVGDVLDALDVPAASVVGSSLGGYLALRSAAAEPGRVDRMVQMACPAFAPGMLTPPFMRVMATPVLGRIVRALPPSERAGTMMMRQIGHGASLDAGRIAPEFMAWYLALQRHTDTMANDGALISLAAGPRGFDPSLTMAPALLGAVKAPSLLYWGADDAFGGGSVARRLADLLPDAEIEMVPEAGHLPWLDDPERAASAVVRFLA
jgi:2-hydroxy-6-oxonona-2,4-dienedioate hydrolase